MNKFNDFEPHASGTGHKGRHEGIYTAFATASASTTALPPLAPSTSAEFTASDGATTLAMPPIATTSADSEQSTGGNGITTKKRRRIWPIVTGAVLAFLLAALIACFFAGRWYFQDKAAPGVHLGNVSVMGQNREQLTDTVNQQAAATKVNFNADGRTSTLTLDDLGAKVDVDKTVDALLNAKPAGSFASSLTRLNILSTSYVPLDATTNDATAQNAITNALIDEANRAQVTDITYDANAKGFTLVQGRDGMEPEPTAVKAAVAQAIASPGTTTSAKIELVTAKNPISNDMAQQAVKEANARTGLSLTVGNGEDKTVTIPADQIAQWVKPRIDSQTGAVTMNVDHDAVAAYLKQDSVIKQLSVPMTSEEVYITPKSEGGVRIGADKTLGHDGIEVTSTDNAAATISTALENGQDAHATVETKVTPFDQKEVEVPHDFDKANGDKWVHVDLTNQTATAYQGTTVVKTFLIASGQPTADGSRLSDTGTFYVYLKYESQTMTGEGYSQPNTPWISYYNGGEALHGAPAYMWGEHPIYIQQGVPGSHGCINMQVNDAKWMYDFATIGTRVVVDGTTPTSGEPIRQAGPDATGWQGGAAN